MECSEKTTQGGDLWAGGIWGMRHRQPSKDLGKDQSKTTTQRLWAVKSLTEAEWGAEEVIRSFRGFPGGAVVKNPPAGTSLVAQWFRIRLPMQGTWVRVPVREDPTCRGATKFVRHNHWACALEPASHNYWDREPRARAPQQEKPPHWEAHAPQRRVAPAHRN